MNLPRGWTFWLWSSWRFINLHPH